MFVYVFKRINMGEKKGIFYINVEFGYLGFCMGKCQIADFYDSVVAYDIKVGICNQLNELL